ncbi:unknown [Firmicutes bacterium CAG:83]|mgnify:FL=1|nr:unknown [Firmicutes bacterium CAG:83]
MSEIIVTLKGGIEIGTVKIYVQNCLQAPAE